MKKKEIIIETVKGIKQVNGILIRKGETATITYTANEVKEDES